MSFPQQCIIAQNCHGLYCIPMHSAQRPAASAVINHCVWEPETIALVCKFADVGDVIHAGTFFGDFLPPISRALFPFAKLWAFEPNSENFQAAAITCRLNGLKNVELHRCGLGEGTYRRTLKIGEDGTSLGGASHILERDAESGEDAEEITLVAIDSVIPRDRRVSVLQLDIEGYERAALAGAVDTIIRWRPLIILETLPEDWVREHLTPLGYRVAGHCHGNSVLAAGDLQI